MLMGTVRVFIAPHQLDEVRRHLPRVAAQAGVDPAKAIHTFESTYAPILCQVDTTGMLADDPLVAEVAEVDGADVDTARLAVLLGVRVVTENKVHFRQVAILNDWLTVVAAYADAGLFDGANAGVMVSVNMTGEGAVAAARAAHKGVTYLAEHPRVAVGLGIAMLIIVLLGLVVLSDDDRRERVRRFGADARQASAKVVKNVATLYGRTLEAAAKAEPVLIAALLPSAETTTAQSVARRLAASRWPVPTAELIAGMSQAQARALTRMLRESPAFVKTTEGWMLGSPPHPKVG